jgi:putative ABC transport system substrate-binding protein
VIDRRAFISGITVGLLAAPLAAEAQQTRKVPRVGVLGGQSLEMSPPILALREGLRELGYVEGENITIEWRWAQGKDERYSDLAAELVKLKVDIIVAATTTGAQAAQRATRTIPIVMGFVSDPVALGLVANLARPGGNITGVAVQPEMAGKRLQLLREAAPTVARIAVLNDPSQPGTDLRETEAAARALGVELKLGKCEAAASLTALLRRSPERTRPG